MLDDNVGAFESTTAGPGIGPYDTQPALADGGTSGGGGGGCGCDVPGPSGSGWEAAIRAVFAGLACRRRSRRAS